MADLPRSPAAAAALFLSCCCCTGRGLDTRLGLLFAARTEFICRLVWVAGGEGGNPPATGASSGRGGKGGSPGAAASQQRAAGKEGGAFQAGVPPLLLPSPRRLRSRGRGATVRWLSRALAMGDVRSAAPLPNPPEIPLKGAPRSCPSQARRCSVAGGAIDTARDTHSQGGSPVAAALRQSPPPTQPPGGRAANPRARSMGGRGERGAGCGGAAERGYKEWGGGRRREGGGAVRVGLRRGGANGSGGATEARGEGAGTGRRPGRAALNLVRATERS